MPVSRLEFSASDAEFAAALGARYFDAATFFALNGPEALSSLVV